MLSRDKMSESQTSDAIDYKAKYEEIKTKYMQFLEEISLGGLSLQNAAMQRKIDLQKS